MCTHNFKQVSDVTVEIEFILDLGPPGDQENLIYEHYVFEAENINLDGDVPKPGDVVNVIHPWAFGFTNKVGIYLGKVAEGMAPTLSKTSSNFKNKKNSRSKTVPNE